MAGVSEANLTIMVVLHDTFAIKGIGRVHTICDSLYEPAGGLQHGGFERYMLHVKNSTATSYIEWTLRMRFYGHLIGQHILGRART